MAETWIRTDEAEDVAGSIRHALQCKRLIDEDAQAWKWFALAIHSALQGACVCHLTTTAVPIGAITPCNKKEWLVYFEKIRQNPQTKIPQTRLLNFPSLLEAVRQQDSAGDHSSGSGIKIDDQELAWLNAFHKMIRNQFVHFEPMGWSIEISGTEQLAVSTARIVAKIAKVAGRSDIKIKIGMLRFGKTFIHWPH